MAATLQHTFCRSYLLMADFRNWGAASSAQAITENPLNRTRQREAFQVQIAAEARGSCRLPLSQGCFDDGASHLQNASCSISSLMPDAVRKACQAWRAHREDRR